MYDSIDLYVKSIVFNKLVPQNIIQSLKFETLRIPVVGHTPRGYFIMTKVFYSMLYEKISSEMITVVENYRKKLKERSFNVIFLSDCEDVVSDI